MEEERPIIELDEQISDKAGRHYRLNVAEVGSLWVLRVFDGPVFVAQSNCQTEPPVLHLGDIRVLDDAFCPETRIGRFLRRLTRRPEPRVNYRCRGLGSSLLKYILRRATEKGFHRITGRLFPVDMRANPDLPDWYRRFGFVVQLHSPENGTITLTLQPPPLDGLPTLGTV